MARPATEQPLEVIAIRLPPALIAHARRYADLYQTSLSALAREGLDMRLRSSQHPKKYDGNTNIPSATLALLLRLATTLTATAEELRTACHGDTEMGQYDGNTEVLSEMYDGNTESIQEQYDGNTETILSTYDSNTQRAPKPYDGMTAHPEAIPAEPIQQPDIPPFDTRKYALGALCTHGHAYHRTGHSLRRLSDRECIECHRARARAYRQRQRQAPPATLGQARIEGAQDRSTEEKRQPEQRTSAAAVPPFDPVKHHLGKLCAHGHAWGSSGQSLRANNKAGYCLACNAALNKAKRQARPA